MDWRVSAIAVCVGLMAPSGCALRPAPRSDVDRRLSRLESELAELKQGEAAGAAPGGAPEAPPRAAQAPQAAEPGATAPSGAAPAPAPQAPATPPAEKPLLVWNVTPDITFRPGARLQVRYSYDSISNNHDIAVQRFRLKGAGELYKVTKYGLEMKIDNTGKTGASPSAAVENGWLEYAPVAHVAARAGLYDVPFSRDALTSDSKLLLQDRSLIKDALTAFGLADNGIGGMLHGRPLGGHLEYAAGVFNNDKFDGFKSSRTPRAGWPMLTGRVVANLLDPAPSGGYADYRASYVGEGRRLAIGVNGEWLGNAEDSSLNQFDVFAVGTDAFFNCGPYTLQAEYDWFRQTGNVDRSNYGWFVQGGYLIEPLNQRLHESLPWFPDLELVSRFQDVDAKSVGMPREQRTSVGLNLYVRQHTLKIQTEYSYRRFENDQDRDLAQVQLQMDF